MDDNAISKQFRKSDGSSFESDIELKNLSAGTQITNVGSGDIYYKVKSSATIFNRKAKTEVDAVTYSAQSGYTTAQKKQARTNIGIPESAVLYNESQSLTDAQKKQARKNIDIDDASDAVLYTKQSLTDAQKARARKNIGITENFLPIGTIVMWSGTAIPSGWALCNGENGTPDLRGRFVIGEGILAGKSYTLKSMGGSPDHFHYFGYSTHDNAGAFFTNGKVYNGTGGFSSNTGKNAKNVALNCPAPTKAALEASLHNANYVSSEIKASMVGWNGNDGYLWDSKGLTHGNMITSLTYPSVANAKDPGLPPYYVLYFIMKIS